jgi:hypothetical protein
MKSTKKSSKAKAVGKPARAVTKAKKPAVSKAKPAKAAKAAKAAAASKSTRAAAQTAKAAPAAPPAKPVHEWAEAIKKAALQNKQGHNSWPGAGSPSWKGKQRPE